MSWHPLTDEICRAQPHGRGPRPYSQYFIDCRLYWNEWSFGLWFKASLIGFTRSLAREVGRVGVTVNAVAPGFIATEMTAGLSAEDRAGVRRRRALGRLAEVEDVANAALYLMDDKARNVTGTVLTVDAGAVA
jgi:enoyl-[acyl-carrier-protein] reductase (NADH)